MGSSLIAVSLLDGPACVIGFVYFAGGINLIGDVSLVLLCDCICCINFCIFGIAHYGVRYVTVGEMNKVEFV